MATASYDGVIIIWNIDSGAIKTKMHAADLENMLLTERAVEKVLFLSNAAGMLAACGADGCVRFWSSVDGNLCLEMHARHASGESLLQMCVHPEGRRLVTADSVGGIKVWDISKFRGQTVKSGREVMKELLYFQAHTAAVSSTQYIVKEQGDMLVTASTDYNITLWTIDGIRIGDFGRDSWQIDDRVTWHSREPEPICGAEGSQDFVDEDESVAGSEEGAREDDAPGDRPEALEPMEEASQTAAGGWYYRAQQGGAREPTDVMHDLRKVQIGEV
eukprot:gene7673-9136_t